ncbi:hypothetical protein ACQ4M3_09415 [Leptolyngbya sp. AN03gr2]|uniref:hypothetical protein n=1 Tax=Leptolyngbya sp. AN03gr2 TaxID=3423364 RepID=UPI003D3236B9
MKDKARSQVARAARKSERTNSDRLNQKVSRLTVASGAVNGDGDAVHTAGETTLRVEKKRRGKNVKSYSVTAEEYRKGLQQKIDVWAITVEGGETLYLLREDTYAQLLAIANIKENYHA